MLWNSDPGLDVAIPTFCAKDAVANPRLKVAPVIARKTVNFVKYFILSSRLRHR